MFSLCLASQTNQLQLIFTCRSRSSSAMRRMRSRRSWNSSSSSSSSSSSNSWCCKVGRRNSNPQPLRSALHAWPQPLPMCSLCSPASFLLCALLLPLFAATLVRSLAFRQLSNRLLAQLFLFSPSHPSIPPSHFDQADNDNILTTAPPPPRTHTHPPYSHGF